MIKINNKLNVVFAFYLVAMPLVATIFDCFKLNFNLFYQLVTWAIIYFVVLIISFILCIWKRGKTSFNPKFNIGIVFALLMLLVILLSSCINASFNSVLVIYLSYFLIFYCVYMLDKKHRSILLDVLIVIMAICCIMGFIDPLNKFMPGFGNFYGLSLQFSNPNYAAYIISALTIICFIKFNKLCTKLKFYYLVCYLIFAVYLFMNGSFMPISALFLCEIIALIYVSVKNKKCQYKLLSLLLILIPICLLVDLIPNIKIIRTCPYNYFIECVAVFDNIFNTKLLSIFNINTIAGADGWDRQNLLNQSLKAGFDSPKRFIFGGGAGTFYKFRPHNGFLSLMLDFGLFMPMLYLAMLVYIVVKAFKANNKTFKLAFSLVIMSSCYLVGSIVYTSYYVFVILLALCCSEMFKQN